MHNSLKMFCLIFYLLRAFDNVALGMLRLFVLLSTENFPVSKLTCIIFSSLQYSALGKKLEFQLSHRTSSFSYSEHAWAHVHRTSKKEKLRVI